MHAYIHTSSTSKTFEYPLTTETKYLLERALSSDFLTYKNRCYERIHSIKLKNQTHPHNFKKTKMFKEYEEVFFR